MLHNYYTCICTLANIRRQMHTVYNIYIYIYLLACKPMASCNISCGGGAKKNRNLEGPVAHLGQSAQPAQSHLVHPDLRKSWTTAG